MRKNSLKRGFSFCFFAFAFNVILEHKQKELPQVSKNIKSILLKNSHAIGNCVGRSMIEMLGVLAIIAVLTVGGIAGYSKAMEKLQINRTINEYNSMLVNVFENLDSFTSKNSWSSTIIVQALNIAPAGWKVEKTSHLNMMSDNTGNKIAWFPENDRQLRIIFRLGGGAAHQQNLCMSLINDVFLPLRSVIGMLYFSSGGIYYYLGDNYCPENRKPWDKCMSYLNVNNISWQCANCAKSSVGCVLNVLFYH